MSRHLLHTVLLGLVLAAGNVSAAPVTVGLWENRPMCYTDEDGNPAGIFVAVLEYVAKLEDWQLEYKSGSWPELRGELEAGRIEILPSMAVTPEREQIHLFNDIDVFNNWAVVYTRPDSPINSLLALSGRRVATLAEGIYTNGPEGIVSLNENFNLRARVMPVRGYGEALAAVRDGEADAAVVNRLFGAVNGETYGLVSSGIVFAPVKIRFALCRSDPRAPGLAAALDRHILDLRNDSQSNYHRAINEALGDSGGQLLPKWFWPVALLALGLLALLAAVALLLRWQVWRRTGELRRANAQLSEDVEKRREVEAALRVSEERFRALVEKSADWIWESDEHDVFTYASPRVADLLGYVPQEVIGRSAFDFVQVSERDAVAREFVLIKEAKRSFSNLMTVNRHKDGRLVTIESSGVPIIDSQGVFRGYRGIDRDISERKDMESKLRQAYKMEAIGTLAGGIAHDFNNILAAIIGYTELAQADAAERLPAAGSMNEVMSAALRARDLVRQILTFSRQTGQEMGPLNVAAVTTEVARLLRASIPTTVEFDLDIDADAGLIWADSTQIHQVVMNLCTNAAQSMAPRGGTLTLGLVGVTIAPSLATPDLPAGDHVRLTVGDTGAGIEAALLKRIFDPYFTTKELGKGTGMGLAVVHGIVQSHHGTITVTSRPGEGTTFEIHFPTIREQAEAARPDSRQLQAAPGRGERVLFVDDEWSVASMAEALLKRLGYTPTTCTSSIEALEVFRGSPGGFDVVVTDQTMPGLTGLELSREIRRLAPAVPVILCSGYSELTDRASLHEAGVCLFLMKPFNGRDLSVAIGRALAGKSLAS